MSFGRPSDTAEAPSQPPLQSAPLQSSSPQEQSNNRATPQSQSQLTPIGSTGQLAPLQGQSTSTSASQSQLRPASTEGPSPVQTISLQGQSASTDTSHLQPQLRSQAADSSEIAFMAQPALLKGQSTSSYVYDTSRSDQESREDQAVVHQQPARLGQDGLGQNSGYMGLDDRARLQDRGDALVVNSRGLDGIEAREQGLQEAGSAAVTHRQGQQSRLMSKPPSASWQQIDL